MRAMIPKLFRISPARDADHQPKFPVQPRLDSREGILDDNRPYRLNPEQLRRHQKRIGGRFTSQVLGMDHIPIDPDIEEGIQFGDP